MRIADLDTDKLYAIRTTHHGSRAGVVLRAKQWIQRPGLGQTPNLYVASSSVRNPEGATTSMSERKGVLTLISNLSVGYRTDVEAHTGEIERLRAAAVAVRAVLVTYEAVPAPEVRKAIVDAVGEEYAPQITVSLAQPNGITGEFADEVAAEKREHERSRAQHQQREQLRIDAFSEREAARPFLTEVLGFDPFDDDNPARPRSERVVRSTSEHGYAAPEALMPWSFVNRLIAEARAAGAVDAAKAIAEAEHEDGGDAPA